jgi:hypothetical protein
MGFDTVLTQFALKRSKTKASETEARNRNFVEVV